ncbi:glycosyltransferase [Staphylococcus gallinarum]|uniref:Glycosyltransferase n=1 Tax=Staphylococcus gallinarum TaxID=1293 RepID=A0A380FNQ5_STAGA|nr:glycosyltransferase [Staphylococcus gallinarum]
MEIEFLKTLINPNQLASKIQFEARYLEIKKELIYIPLAVNDKTRFKFSIKHNELVAIFIERKNLGTYS